MNYELELTQRYKNSGPKLRGSLKTRNPESGKGNMETEMKKKYGI